MPKAGPRSFHFRSSWTSRGSRGQQDSAVDLGDLPKSASRALNPGAFHLDLDYTTDKNGTGTMRNPSYENEFRGLC